MSHFLEKPRKIDEIYWQLVEDQKIKAALWQSVCNAVESLDEYSIGEDHHLHYEQNILFLCSPKEEITHRLLDVKLKDNGFIELVTHYPISQIRNISLSHANNVIDLIHEEIAHLKFTYLQKLAKNQS